MTTFRNRLQLIARTLLTAFFQPAETTLVRVGMVVGLYLLGVWLWGVFFSWGNIAFDFLDWGEVTGPRLALLKSAAQQGVLPLHSPNPTALRGVTDRYLAIPDTPLSPQYLLLRFLGLSRFVFFDTLLLYTLGFIGLAWLAFRYRLSPAVFAALFLLINGNGYITSHLAVGHSIWTGYFLLPFFVLLVLHLVEHEQAGWRWTAGVAAVLVLILLQGFFHLFLWCLLFLALLALIRPRLILPVARAGLFAILLSLPRLLPPALVLTDITHENLGGFSSLTDLLSSMIVLQDPDRAMRLLTDTFPLGPWETDFYLGLLGFAFLALFGVLAPLRAHRNSTATNPYLRVFLVCLVFTVLSIGNIYGQLVKLLPVPPFTGERVTSRMFVLPLVFLLVYAAISAQRWLNTQKLPGWVQIVLLGGLGLVFHDLNQHMRAWRVRQLDSMTYLFPKLPFDLSQHTIANHADPSYTSLLLVGSGLALASLLVLLVLAARENRRLKA